jgi:PAS domain S-box-containing protein
MTTASKVLAEAEAARALQAEAALRDRERELSLLVDMVPSHLWRLTPDGEPIFFNKRMVDFLGLDVTDMDKPGMTRLEAVIEIVHADDAAKFRDALKRCLVTGESFAMRYRLRRADGVYRWMSSRAEPMRDRDGRIVQWYGLCHDIDDQMRAEEALRGLAVTAMALSSCRSLDEVMRTITDRAREIIGAHMAVIGTTIDQHWAQAIQAASLSHKYAAYRDFEAKPDGSGIYAVVCDLNRPMRLTQAQLEAHPAWRGYGKYADQHPRLRGWLAVPLIDSNGRNMGLLQLSDKDHGDFTAEDEGIAVQLAQMASLALGEARLHESLANSERQLRQLIDAVPALIWCTTPEGIPCYLNKRVTDVTGGTLKELIAPDGSRSLTVIHPDDRDAIDQAMARSFETGTPFVGRYRQRRSNGPHRWVESRAEPLRDDSGNIVQWYGVSVDIHDLVTAQETLRDRERELSQLVNMVPSLLWRLNPDGEPNFFNKRTIDFLGLDVADYDRPGMSRLAATLAAIIHPDDAASVTEAFNHSFVTGERFSMQYRLRRADGVYRWVSGRAEPMRDERGHIVQWYGLAHDIDDQMRAEEALRQASDKLARATQAASLAELSASIAHEVNQPLAAIVANSHACQRWLSAAAPNIERAKITVERIIRDANSAADVVSHIRALFRQSVETRTSTALPGVIAEARHLMADEAARRRVRIDVDVESSLPLVTFDRVQVQQVLINLMRNGIDAMDSTVGDRVLGMRVRRMGDAVQTEISDRGRGVEFPDKVFEPFFTTKEKGMGMGLAICRSIVESHGGRLWAAKNEPHGATFIFTLPVEAKAAP